MSVNDDDDGSRREEDQGEREPKHRVGLPGLLVALLVAATKGKFDIR